MIFSRTPIRLLLAGLALVQPLRAASDSRRIVSAQPCTLVVKAANGTIDIKTPYATATLRTLYQDGDSFQLEGGKDYVLVFRESREGRFSFDLQFKPAGAGSSWSCRVKTLAVEPYIGVDQGTWSGAPGQITVNTDRTKAFIALNSY
jgi:hypothetical protein